MRRTPNLNLPLQDGNDNFYIEDISQAMETIDESITDIQESINLANGSNIHFANRIVATENKLKTAESQLAEKPSKADTRLKSEKIELEDLSADTLGAMSGNATFNLLSIPQPNSVDKSKLDNEIITGKIPRVNRLKYSLDNPYNAEGLTIDTAAAYQKYNRIEEREFAKGIGVINWLKNIAIENISTGTVYIARVRMDNVADFLGKKTTFKFLHKGSLNADLVGAIYYNTATLTNQKLVESTFSISPNEGVATVEGVIPSDVTRLLFYIYSVNKSIPAGSVISVGAPQVVIGAYVPLYSIHSAESYYTDPVYDNQLATLTSRISNVESEIGATPIDSSPMLVIIDDDARIESYTLWKQLILDKNIKMNIAPMLYKQAVDSNWNSDLNYMSMLQMMELQDLGCEFVNHGNKSVLTATIYDDYVTGNYTRVKQEYVDSKKFFREYGLDRNGGQDYYVYPGNIDGTTEEKENYKNIIKKYFKCGINNGVDVVLNTNNPVDIYDIPRVNADSKTSTFLIGKLDEAIAVNGVLILLSHAYRNTTHEGGDTSVFFNRFNPFIDYAKANNVKIVTLTEMLKLKGLVS